MFSGGSGKPHGNEARNLSPATAALRNPNEFSRWRAILLCTTGRNRGFMNSAKLFVIEYTLHGTPKSFIIRLEKMDNAEAWHWASCDAGVGRIPRFGREKVQKTSKPMAEKFGVENVKWRPAN